MRRTGHGLFAFFWASLAYLRPHWALCLVVLIAIVPTIAFYTLQPLIFRAVVDDAILPGDGQRLLVLVSLLAGLVLLRLTAEVVKEYAAARVGSGVLSDLRIRLFAHLQYLSLDFYGRSEAGDLVFRYTND